jgi:hypothetical protein
VKDEGDPDYGKKEVSSAGKNEVEEENHSIFKKSPELVTKSASKKTFSPQATVTLLNVKEMFDRNQNKYLLLETNNLPNNVFVFDYKVESNR